MSLNVSITDDVTPAFQAAVPKISDAISEGLEAVYQMALPGLEAYPPAPPKSKRTGLYGISFYTEPDTDGFFVLNSAPYSGYVGGDDQTQAAADIGWQKVSDFLSTLSDDDLKPAKDVIMRLFE